MPYNFISIATLLLAALLSGCAKEKEKEKEAESAAPVQVGQARRAPIRRVVTSDGILRALDQSAIMPKISAPVRSFTVNRGDHVQKGQLLAVLENRDLAAAVADAKGAYDQANAQYRMVASATVPEEVVKAQQDVDAAKQAMDAGRKLLESREQLFKEGALARRLVDEAAVSYAQAKSQYETAQNHLQSLQSVGKHEEVKGAAAQLDSAKARYEAAQAQLSYSEVHSPISGVVSDRAIFPGEMAAAGSPLITVMDVSSVIARLNVPLAQAAYIRVGQPGHIASTDGALEADGKVTVVSPSVDPQSTTVEVWVQAANPGERLHPGGTVHATIDAGEIPDAIVVPASALLPSDEGGTVLLVVGADMTVHQRAIEVGVRDRDLVQIVKGVNAGERVVTGGGVGVQDGAKVKIEAAAEHE
jgi:HlyD family secretion protein